jgi:uncharacterized FAD-dependent dehydrogenase
LLFCVSNSRFSGWKVFPVPILLRNIALDFRESDETLKNNVLRRFSLSYDEITYFRIIRKALDARKKSSIKFVYTIEFAVPDEEAFLRKFGNDPDIQVVAKQEKVSFPRIGDDRKIIIVGMGPAGLFAAIRLSEYGLTGTLVERGKPVEERIRDVQTFWSRGYLDSESNVQFGEGGAGTFSDGKLTSRSRDENLGYTLGKLVQFGAPREILYLGKPHIGTDRLRHVIREIRRNLERLGFEICFRRKLTDIACSGGHLAGVVLDEREERPCDFLVLAPGHSARDTYEMLMRRSVLMQQKPFAVGLRVEHPQGLIDRIQYGIADRHQLPAAEYALAYANPRTHRSVYSFCMCPGGVIVAGSSEPGMVVTNGMSNYLRNSPYANSALVVPVGGNDFPGQSPLAGVEFQRFWERKAFRAGGGNYCAPAQNLVAFLGKGGARSVSTTYRPGVREANLDEVLPDYVVETIKDGIHYFNRKMRGFTTEEATLTGIETRTSAPVRIVRGEDLQSVNLKGLYPAGEGAGYAGGIMSAALDGIRVADRIALQIMERKRSTL